MTGARRALAPGAVALGWLLLTAHVGSPNVVFEGAAGPYPVRVIIRPPEAIPGLADITVRVAAEGVERVLVRPVRWDLGHEGAPRPDAATAVEAGSWTAQLWFMESGSYSVHVTVEGEAGTGRVIVPVPARATRIADMSVGLQASLVGLGLFLLVGLLSIVGAAAREANLPPGEAPDPRRRRRSRVAQIVSVPVLGLALFGGARWWEAEETYYERNLYVPLSIETAATTTPGGRDLVLSITDDRWTSDNFTTLLPDHGKLMHLFLVGAPGVQAFAHLHPIRLDSATFRTPLPPLPPGEYRLYADILHESGYTQTLTDTVALPAVGTRAVVGAASAGSSAAAGASPAPGASAPAGASAGMEASAGPGAAASMGGTATPAPPAALDPDDSWLTGATAAPAGGRAALEDGSVMTWTGEPAPRAGRETTLAFRIDDPDGAPATLDPYMGMGAHAAIARDDGSVFVHLHPLGTISMTSQQLFERREGADEPAAAVGAADHAAHAIVPRSTVSLPYEFPRPGRYTIWVQVKRAGRVLTGSFQIEVAA